MARRTNEHLRRVPGLLLILGALTAFAPMSIDRYLPSLPTPRLVLATDAASVQLTLVAFCIGLAGGQLVYGPAAGMFAYIAGSPFVFIALFWYVASLGMVSPNAVAVALGPFPNRAGSASALPGTIQFGLATVGRLSDGGAVPMAVVMAGCGATSLMEYQFLPRRQ